MRILYCIPRYWPSIGGAQLLTRELIHRIARNHSVRVVTQFTSDRDSFLETATKVRPDKYQDGDIEVFNVGPTGLWRPVMNMLRKFYGPLRIFNPVFAEVLRHVMISQIREIAASFKPEILHAVHIGLIYSSEAALRAARSLGIPFVWTPVPHIESGEWTNRHFKKLYRTSDFVIAMTEREKLWLTQQGVLQNRVQVVPCGPIVHSSSDGELFRKKHNLNGVPIVLFLAQKLPYKGYKELLGAAPLVWDQIPDVHFVFVGPRTSESEKVFGLVKDSRILELPSVDLYEKTSALAACDVFCMPSVQESLGGVYLEAWSLRKPVIAANIHIAQEVIDNGKDGLLTEPTPPAIAQAILMLLTNKPIAQAMGEAGYEKVKNQYDWNVLANRMEEVYRNCLL